MSESEPPAIEDRTIRAPLCPILEPITKVTEIEFFKACFRAIFAALHALRGLGIAHGDISPANILCYNTKTQPFPRKLKPAPAREHALLEQAATQSTVQDPAATEVEGADDDPPLLPLPKHPPSATRSGDLYCGVLNDFDLAGDSAMDKYRIGTTPLARGSLDKPT
ncbi:hypothetical protein DFH11DRAFT_1540603 [Phellopilus nigrolimitatus]|nr:hypothetical protein DFH11DRAFT_1540603 [Phellopilus nigrolimitatus]